MGHNVDENLQVPSVGNYIKRRPNSPVILIETRVFVNANHCDAQRPFQTEKMSLRRYRSGPYTNGKQRRILPIKRHFLYLSPCKRQVGFGRSPSCVVLPLLRKTRRSAALLCTWLQYVTPPIVWHVLRNGTDIEPLREAFAFRGFGPVINEKLLRRPGLRYLSLCFVL